MAGIQNTNSSLSKFFCEINAEGPSAEPMYQILAEFNTELNYLQKYGKKIIILKKNKNFQIGKYIYRKKAGWQSVKRPNNPIGLAPVKAEKLFLNNNIPEQSNSDSILTGRPKPWPSL